MNLAYHLYELQWAAPLGAVARGLSRSGALLRVQFPGDKIGYADLHPWTELGDLPLPEQLDRLRQGETTDLTRASLAFAALDAEARAAGRSVWDGLTVPASHLLLPGIETRNWNALEAALAEGFSHFKIKLGKDLEGEQRSLRELSSFLRGVSVAGGGAPRLRLDYNETLTPARFAEYFAGMETLRPHLDFIEDPYPFEPVDWTRASERFRIRFAVDRAASERAADDFDGVLVYKSARSGPFPFQDLSERHLRRRLIVTSYLDHPLGQLCAAWVAARMPESTPGERHGLVSHRVYTPTRFSDRLGWSGPRLRLPEGHGFGFDQELAETDWRTLD